LEIVAAGAVLAACGCSSSPVAPTPSASPPGPTTPAPGESPTVTISASGFSPPEITLPIAGRVTFVNADRIGRDIASGLEHNSRECSEVDVVGFLNPGERRQSAAFDQAKTCRFHEHSNVGNPAWQGRIVIQ
jgi:hypothetical protein